MNTHTVMLPETFRNVKLILLDMDGVITSEEAYWDAAGLVVRDVLESPAYLGLNPNVYTPIINLFYQQLAKSNRNDWRAYLPTELIHACKSRGINSNWDLAYLCLGLYFAPLAAPVLNALLAPPVDEAKAMKKEASQATGRSTHVQSSVGEHTLSRMREMFSPVWDRLLNCVQNQAFGETLRLSELHLWGAYLRSRKQTLAPGAYPGLSAFESFNQSAKGVPLLDELNRFVDDRNPVHPLWFSRRSCLWNQCQDLFQQWYLGESLYMDAYKSSVPYGPKPGLIHKEEPLHGRESTHACLAKLAAAGYTLGIATGRPRMEIITPLKRWGMLRYFDANRIVTHDEIDQAESSLKAAGQTLHLGKPHPYVFLKAAFPECEPDELVRMAKKGVPHPNEFTIVGDAQADIWAAHEIGCPSVAVLTGAAGHDGGTTLKTANPSVIFDSIFEFTDALLQMKN